MQADGCYYFARVPAHHQGGRMPTLRVVPQVWRISTTPMSAVQGFLPYPKPAVFEVRDACSRSDCSRGMAVLSFQARVSTTHHAV